MTDKELQEAKECLIEEYKWKQWCKDWERRNLIQFDNYFKYSGQTEEVKVIVGEWKFHTNTRINELKERYEKVKKRTRAEKSSKSVGESFI